MQPIPFIPRTILFLLLYGIAALFPNRVQSQTPSEPKLASDLRQRVDSIVNEVLLKTGVPSASIAVVKDDQIAYVEAYGQAKLDPRTPARPNMRYGVGSISKQFTAAAILLLAEQGKLSLDDPVSRWLPDLTRANEVTVRELLSHTSGYQDFWPQDYVLPLMTQPGTPEKILDMWAKKPLDFDPGTRWQYSNTNYVIAGVIFEKASGLPLGQYLSERIFTPLHMESAVDVDRSPLTENDAAGYMRYALGPPRPATKTGAGWLFAAGELSMTAEDLARWDIAMADHRLLKPSSYKEMQTEVQLKNGVGTQYGLGVIVGQEGGHRTISHGGEISGFTASNVVLPDDRAAVVVLTNQDAASAAGQISRRVVPLLIASKDAVSADKEQRARKIFEELQGGRINRSLFTANANSYFSEEALKDFAASLQPLGVPQEFVQSSQTPRGGMTLRAYRARFPQKTLSIVTFEMPDGKLEQYQVAPVE